jgi:tRNA pseudouridine13 synthase
VKIKELPGDFVVEELAPPPSGRGPLSVYRLEKSGITTIDAVALVAREFALRRDRIRHGGLKDRHARTTQHVWVEGGPERSLAGKDATLTFLGKSDAPPAITGNRFSIVLRDLVPSEAARLGDAARATAADGVPNYFDSQRFGSARHGEGFAGKRFVQRRYEEALQLHFTRPSPFDSESRRTRMLSFRRHWGQWETCLQKAATRTEDHFFSYLMRRRGDFKGATKVIERSMLALLMHTYQSWLWNEAVKRLLKRDLPSDVVMPARYLGGLLLFYRFIPADMLARWRSLQVPLLAYRTRFADAAVEGAYSEVLRAERITQEEFKAPGHNLPYMKGQDRSLLLVPACLEAGAPEADERHPARQKAFLRFELPRGGYATLIVKRLRLLISDGADAPDDATPAEEDG